MNPLTLPLKWLPPHKIFADTVGATFAQATAIESATGELSTTLDLGWVVLHSAVHSLITRAFSGSIPGPTFRVKSGDTLRIRFRNRLVAQPSADGAPERPDDSNLHFHGLHGSGTLPGDDVTQAIGPRAEHTYIVEIPSDHMPGTFWIHPHVHGSSTLQGGSGAAATLIIDDPPGYLPATLSTARELIWVVQYFANAQQWAIAKNSGDETYAVFDPATLDGDGDGDGDESMHHALMEDFALVNGLLKPRLAVAPGEWTRWRLIYPGQRANPGHALDLALDSAGGGATAASCEMKLLAKDGIYIRDFPRAIRTARVPAGGRADVMVRCAAPGQVTVTAEGRHLATLDVTGPSVSSDSLAPWSPASLPSYLHDVNDMAAPSSSPSSLCSCETRFGECTGRFSHLSGERCVNGRPYSDTEYLHVAPLGALQQRSLRGLNSHPYHQHMYPFQLTSGFDESEYFKIGDWHDTWQDSSIGADSAPTMRFRPLGFAGRMMVHCHWLVSARAGT